MRSLILGALTALLLVAAPAAAQAPAQTPAAATTQNTITTTGPVSSETKISLGSWAGEILNWIMAAFGVPIGGMIVWVLVRVLKKLGIDATDSLRARLQEMVVYALHYGVAVAQAQSAGRGTVDVKNRALSEAIAYVQAHGADTIKALGLDPESGAAVKIIQTRIAAAIADPAQPTPPELGGPPPLPLAAPPRTPER